MPHVDFQLRYHGMSPWAQSSAFVEGRVSDGSAPTVVVRENSQLSVIGSPHNSAGGGAWRDEYLRRAVQNCRRAILGETPWNLIGSDERML